MGQSARRQDLNGWFEVEGNPISKVGVFPYSGKFISPDLDPNTLYSVYRPAEELSDPECLQSFKLVPWTNDHPRRLLGTGEGAVKPEDKGIEGVIGEKVYFDPEDQMLKANIKVFSAAHADRINSGKEELSAGYQCTYEYNPGTWNGEEYQYIQRNIRGNHLASVDDGRMGPDVSVMDSVQFTIDSKEFKPMKKTNKIRKVMNALIRYAHDAEEKATEPEEKSEMAQLQDLLKKVTPLMQQISQLNSVMASPQLADEPDGDEGQGPDPLEVAAKDAEEEKKKEDEAKAAKDAEEEKLKGKEKDPEKKEGSEKGKGSGMDAKEIEKIVDDAVKAALSRHAMDEKDMLVKVGQRDRLAQDLSWHIGTFDHAEMTHQEVAEYGVKKLGIPAPKGHEAAVLAGYLIAKKAPKPAATGMDKKEGASFIDKHLENKEK